MSSNEQAVRREVSELLCTPRLERRNRATFIVGTFVLLLLIISSCTNGGPGHLTARGTLAIPSTHDRVTFRGAGVDHQCVGTNGFDDLHAGARIAIRDGRGKILRVGRLGRGVPVAARYGETFSCVFPFTIEDVSSNHHAYLVKITRRRGVIIRRSQLGRISLALR